MKMAIIFLIIEAQYQSEHVLDYQQIRHTLSKVTLQNFTKVLIFHPFLSQT